MVGDVAADSRYPMTFPSTRSEIVVPILDVVDGRARGMIDVESDLLNAFGETTARVAGHCAAELATDMSPSPGDAQKCETFASRTRLAMWTWDRKWKGGQSETIHRIGTIGYNIGDAGCRGLRA